jgi:signal peptidase I
MEPAFYRGDLLFLTMSDGPVKAGEIPVFNIEGRDIPIVHRALKSHIEYVQPPDASRAPYQRLLGKRPVKSTFSPKVTTTR